MKSCFEPATPESQGVPSRAVLDFLEDLNDRGLEMHAFSILRHGKCIAQGSWYPYRTDMEHNVFSFSKSIMAPLISFSVRYPSRRVPLKRAKVPGAGKSSVSPSVRSSLP